MASGWLASWTAVLRSLFVPQGGARGGAEHHGRGPCSAAQSVVGELLWLSARTRPDLSFGVSWMGRRVTKSPRQVVKFAGHMLGYVKETQHLCLRYQGCQGDHGPLQELPLPRKTTRWRSMRMPVLHQKEVGASMGRLGCMVVEWSHGHRAFSP